MCRSTGQYDCNGKMIYDNDIVEVQYKYDDYTESIIMDSSSVKDMLILHGSLVGDVVLKVTGNKYGGVN